MFCFGFHEKIFQYLIRQAVRQTLKTRLKTLLAAVDRLLSGAGASSLLSCSRARALSTQLGLLHCSVAALGAGRSV